VAATNSGDRERAKGLVKELEQLSGKLIGMLNAARREYEGAAEEMSMDEPMRQIDHRAYIGSSVPPPSVKSQGLF